MGGPEWNSGLSQTTGNCQGKCSKHENHFHTSSNRGRTRVPVRLGLDACRCIDRLSCFTELRWLFVHCWQANSATRPEERTLKYCYFCEVHFCVQSVFCSLWFGCMVDYFVESHGGVKGDEQYHVAIRVDGEPTCCDVGAVPRRSFAMCGDPQAQITNRCAFTQCKSGKNRLICSEESEQVARVSVFCKLGTRATQNSAYRRWRAGVKCNLVSMTL